MTHDSVFDGLPTEEDQSQQVIVDWSLMYTPRLAHTVSTIGKLPVSMRAAAFNHLEIIRHTIDTPALHWAFSHIDIEFGLQWSADSLDTKTMHYTFQVADQTRHYELVELADRYLVAELEPIADGAKMMTIAQVNIFDSSEVPEEKILRRPGSELADRNGRMIGDMETYIADFFALTEEGGQIDPALELFLTMPTHWTNGEFYIDEVTFSPIDEALTVVLYHNSTANGMRFVLYMGALRKHYSQRLEALQ